MDTTAADQRQQENQVAPPSERSGDKKVRPPQKDEIVNCPRCHSTNTKFCYYNNYSLTQPRYFCKTCRRYWTAGGTLRNVPVGGGSRKNKRSSQNPNYNIKPHENQAVNLAFSTSTGQEYHGFSQFLQAPKLENSNNNIQLNLNSSFSSSSCTTSTSTSLSAMELLKSTGINVSRGLMNTSFHIPSISMPGDPNMMYSSGFAFPEFKPVAGFAVDGLGVRYDHEAVGVHENINQENNGAAAEARSRLAFPFGSVMSKQIPNTNDEAEQNKGQGNPATFFWKGMSGGEYRSW